MKTKKSCRVFCDCFCVCMIRWSLHVRHTYCIHVTWHTLAMLYISGKLCRAESHISTPHKRMFLYRRPVQLEGFKFCGISIHNWHFSCWNVSGLGRELLEFFVTDSNLLPSRHLKAFRKKTYIWRFHTMSGISIHLGMPKPWNHSG